LRKFTIGALASVLVLAMTAVALGAMTYVTKNDLKQGFGLSFVDTHGKNVTKRAANTGFMADTDLSSPNNHNPEGKPERGATHVRIAFPVGMKFDLTVRPACKATPQQITGSRGAACPRNTTVGTGYANADGRGKDGQNGFGVIKEKVTAFNAKGELFLYLDNASPVFRTYLEGKIKGRYFDVDVPKSLDALGIFLTRFHLLLKPQPVKRTPQIKTIHGKRVRVYTNHYYASTPPKCPSTKKWTSLGTFTFGQYNGEARPTVVINVPVNEACR
jgi:hypothetical protein